MKVTIYFKDDPGTTYHYDMQLDEFKRLSQDFTQYLSKGMPASGVYKCHILQGVEVATEDTAVTLNFDKVRLIG